MKIYLIKPILTTYSFIELEDGMYARYMCGARVRKGVTGMCVAGQS